MKVIFLDIDGVLNNHRYWEVLHARGRESYSLNHRGWDPINLFALKYILLRTGAKIVVSSTWRMGWERCLTCLNEAGLPEPIGRTPRDERPADERNHDARGFEIQCWLDEHPEVTAYVILDDDSDMLEQQMSRFVQTNGEVGLVSRDAHDAIRILNEYPTDEYPEVPPDACQTYTPGVDLEEEAHS